MRNFVYLALVLAACSKSSAQESPPASKSAEQTTAAPAKPPAEPAAAAAAPAAKPADAPACQEGWRITMSQWDFESHLATIDVSCKGGVASMALHDELGTLDTTMPVSAATWDRLWKGLETAKWRDLSAQCAKGRGKQSKKLATFEEQSIDKVGVEITDGTTTKSFTCNGTKVTQQQVELFDLFTDAMLAAMRKS